MSILLIGGDAHGEAREEPRGDRLPVVYEEPQRRFSVAGRGQCFVPGRKLTVDYVRCERCPSVFVLAGYEPTPDDEDVVREWLG